jgi:integrase/recombinase XerD
MDRRPIDLWLHGRPDTTAREYRRELAKLAATLGATPPLEASLEQLQRHVETLAGLAPRSRSRAIAAIRSFYRFHVKARTILYSPAEALATPKTPTGLAERYLTPEEVDRLIAAAPDAVTGLALRLLYEGMLRISEICGLRWGHLLPDGRLTVFGKGSKTRRIELPEGLVADLSVLRAGDGEPMFPAPSGDHLGTRQFHRIFKQAVAAAGLSKEVSCHWMRHSGASHALDNGAPLSLVRDHLGHSSIATTDRYLHAKRGDSAARYLRRS